MPIRGYDVHHPWFQRFLAGHGAHGERAPAGQNLAEMAGTSGVKVLGHDERRGKITRQAGHQRGESRDPSSRRADHHQMVKGLRFLHGLPHAIFVSAVSAAKFPTTLWQYPEKRVIPTLDYEYSSKAQGSRLQGTDARPTGHRGHPLRTGPPLGLSIRHPSACVGPACPTARNRTILRSIVTTLGTPPHDLC